MEEKTEQAPIGRLKFKDFVKGFITAIMSSALTGVYGVIQTGGTVDKSVLSSSLMVGVASGIGYIIKNLLTNSDDKFLKAEPEQK